MIRNSLLSISVGLMCMGWAANAADLPSLPQLTKAKVQILHTKPKLKVKKSAPKSSVAGSAQARKTKNSAVDPDRVAARNRHEIDLAWVFDPLIATADGSKKEGSGEVEGNLVVLERGYLSSPYLIIELSGHVVKTAGATARIDIRIAGKDRKFVWGVEDVKSEAFTIRFNETLSEGKLPANFPIAAFALATKTKQGAVAMVSLEKIRIRVGQVRLANK